MARRRRVPPTPAYSYWQRQVREAEEKVRRGTTPVPRGRGVPKRPTDAARVWAAEQQIMPWEAEQALREVPKPPKRPRTFAEAFKPTAQQERQALGRLRRQRVKWAREALLDPEARKKLVQSAAPRRQLELLRGPKATGRVLDEESFQREVALSRIDRELEKPARTKAERERRAELRRLRERLPEMWKRDLARRGIYGAARMAQSGISGLGDVLLTDEQRAELGEYFGEVMADVQTANEAVRRTIEQAGPSDEELQQAGVFGRVAAPIRRVAKASVATGVESAVGLGPGVVYAVAKPEEALASFEQYLRSYYGTLARGDVSPLYREGVTPALFDILGLAGGVAGGAARAGAIARTAGYRGPLRLSSEGRVISRPEALARAAVLRQEPMPIYGTNVMTMARPVPRQIVGREEPVAAGERIEAGDRVEYRRAGSDEVDWIVASEKNGLVGLETPDVNNPVRTNVRGADVDLLTSYRVGEFAQRMVPRSVIGEFLSNIGWRTRERVSTLRGRGLITGKGARRKRLRQAAEVRLDRRQGAIKAFATEHRRIQKDVVQATAYDRMLRYADPVRGVEQEIAARRQRGWTATREQQQVLAALEQAREVVANPSPSLRAAVVAGRALSLDTEQFLIARGLLTQERADVAKLAAERWLREGHIEDAPLSSPRRTEVERELLDHFGGNEEATRLAMAYTDTLARADGALRKRDPADWYEENIRSVESLTPEQMEFQALDQTLLRQEREVKATPAERETFPLRDPNTGEMRVARLLAYEMVADPIPGDIYNVHLDPVRPRLGRYIESREDRAVVEWVREPDQGLREEVPLDKVDVRRRRGDTATVTWTRGPDAGQPFQIPVDSIAGNSRNLRGWYAGISNQIEKMPERIGRQQVEALKKAPGVKADEWKWLGMDHIVNMLFPSGVKSISRDDLKRAVSQRSYIFHTEHLDRENAFYESQFDVTLPGPKGDYSETLIFYPERWVEEVPDPHDMDDYRWEQARERWYDENRDDAHERWEDDVTSDLENGYITEEQYEAAIEAGPEPEDLERFMPEPTASELEDYLPEIEQEPALYQSDHFVPGHTAAQYSDYEHEYNYSGNLMAHLRQSERWVAGSPIRVIEEMQSDWHQDGRRGYSSTEAQVAYEDAKQAVNGQTIIVRDARRKFAQAINVPGTPIRHRFSPMNGEITPGTGGADFINVRWEDGTAGLRLDPDRVTPREGAPEEALALFDKMWDEESELARLTDEANRLRSQTLGPPEAPYSGMAWEELLFREAVRQAVADGQTRIAWTTGAQQGERYDKLLAANVQRLEYDGNQLVATDTNGETHRWGMDELQGADDQEKLARAVGSGLSKKLIEGFEEVLIEHDKFRVDRPYEIETAEGAERLFSTETLTLPISETRAGDVVWVGYPSDHWDRKPQQFMVRESEDGKRRYLVTSYLDERDWAYARLFLEESTPEGWDGADFARIAKDAQRRQFEAYGESRRKPAVLEGENITVGPGGFISAYDVRLPRYAKKYLGATAQRVRLDDLAIERVGAAHPEHPQYLAPAEQEVLWLHRVTAGDTVLAESESPRAAISAALSGGPDAGIWPSRIRFNPILRREGEEQVGRWEVVGQGGTPGAAAPSWTRVYSDHATAADALEKLERDHRYDADRAGFQGGFAPGAGEVWVVDIPEKFAAELHEKGSPLFQRRRGSVLGLARLTDEGADIYLDRDAADMATWVEEAAHAVIPKWFDDADANGDGRADILRSHLGVEPGGEITAAANEKMVRLLQAWLDAGAIPSPQLRSLFEGLDATMREAYRGGLKSIAKDADEVKEFRRLLRDPIVTSFLRDQFDVAPIRDFEPDLVAFQTMQPLERVTGRRYAGGRFLGPVRSVLPSRRKMAAKPNTMRAWESGNFDVGPEVTAHYANAELRTRIQDEQARRVRDKYMEPIEIVNGVPTLKPGYRVFNYYGIRRAEARIDEMFRRSERYGDITDSEEQMLSADPVTGSIVDMDPEDFGDLTGMTVGRLLADDMIFSSIPEAAARTPRFLDLLVEGKVGQVPEDVIEAFLNASGGGYASGAVSNVLRAIAVPLRIPTMLARWRMILKAAYPIVNTGATGILIGMNQGPVMGLSIRRTLSLSRPTRHRLMQEVGFGVAELADTPPILGGTWIERLQAREHQAFRRWMQVMSMPENHVRLLQIDNDLARAGLRSEVDIVRVLDLAKEGDENATAFLDQIGRHAEDAVIRFRGMSVEEQMVVRDAIFVYGWLRAAARYTLQFPMNRPATADVLFHVGQYGWEKLQDEFQTLAWEQTGSIPIGQRKTSEGFLRKLIDTTQFLPFKSGIDLLRPFFQIMGLQDTGLRPASFADLLSPSAEFALRGVYGQDPRYATSFWDGVKQDFDPRNLPLAYWAARAIDPSLTGTKLRSDRDRWNLVLNFFFGQVAPYEVKESETYQRWLDQQPTDMRTLVREQNNATQLAEFLSAAAKVQGVEATSQQIRAINADSANAIYASLLQSKLRREGKIENEEYLTPVQRAAVKARTLQHYYPDLYEQTLQATTGLDPLGDPDHGEQYVDIWDDAWTTTVSDELSSARDQIETTFGWERVPERSNFPFKRRTRTLQWLQTAPPEAVERIRQRVRDEGIEEERFLYPIIEEEMLSAVRP